MLMFTNLISPKICLINLAYAYVTFLVYASLAMFWNIKQLKWLNIWSCRSVHMLSFLYNILFNYSDSSAVSAAHWWHSLILTIIQAPSFGCFKHLVTKKDKNKWKITMTLSVWYRNIFMYYFSSICVLYILLYIKIFYLKLFAPKARVSSLFPRLTGRKCLTLSLPKH